MKRTIILLTSLILILTVTACGGEVAEAVSVIPKVPEANGSNAVIEFPNVPEGDIPESVIENPSASESNTTESGSEISNTPEKTVTLNTDYINAIPVQMQLILGTVQLEEAEYAVDFDQAAELLPLWKAARSLSLSETAAAEEMEAIFNQIEDTMTAEQLEAIVTMQLTQDDFADIAENLGIEIGSSGGKFGDMTPEQIATTQAGRASGQSPPGGGVPGVGGPAGPQAGGINGSNTPGEIQGQRGATSGINAMFFDAIIEFLDAKVK